jgi:hypothetical protein
MDKKPNYRELLGTACLGIILITIDAFGQELRPNLEAFPASDIAIVEDGGGNLELRFSAKTWDSGAGPVELIAGEVAQGRQNVYQRVYNVDGTYVDHLAGKFVWHQPHNHFHFEDYALYLLQAVTGKSKRSAYKTTFCLMDTELIDGQLPGAPRNAVFDQCGNFAQGISVGWADEYGSHLPGQEIDLTRLKDGDYRLIIRADPRDRILETNENDNESCVLLHITVSTPTPTVDILNASGCDEDSEPPPPGGEVTVTSISPDSAAKGSSEFVTIMGSGFASGMEVILENGRGSRPTVSNVNVNVPDSTITALITVKNGAKAGSWDVRVGSGVLVDGFTVTVP